MEESPTTTPSSSNAAAQSRRRCSASGNGGARGSEGASSDVRGSGGEEKAAVLKSAIVRRVVLATSASRVFDARQSGRVARGKGGNILAADDAECGAEQDSDKSQRLHFVFIFVKLLVYLSLGKLLSD